MDGRVLRGEINRQAIVDAFLGVVAEDGAVPTAQAVGQRARVAKRSVFHHFVDMEALMRAAAEVQDLRHWNLLGDPEPGASLARRVAAAVQDRARLFESVMPVRTVAFLHEHESPVVAEQMRLSRSRLRQHLRRALSPEISSLGRAEVEGLQAMASWETWYSLRRHQRLSVASAQAAIQAVIERTLEGV